MTTVKEPSLADERIKAVEAYIRRNLSRPLKREVLADVAGFSIPHFHRLFSDYTGEPSASFVRRTRLERAGRKLRMGAVDIGEVAAAAGFHSHAAFSKAFKGYFGMSPSEFRDLDCFSAGDILRKG